MKKCLFALLLSFSLLFVSCGEGEKDYFSRNFYAMDTFCELRIYDVNEENEKCADDFKSLILQIENEITVSNGTNSVTAFNSPSLNNTCLSGYAASAFTISREMAGLTDGCFDPTVGALIALWENAGKNGSLPDAAALSHTLESVGYHHVFFSSENDAIRIEKDVPGLMLNFGAIGKGYAADCGKELLMKRGIGCGMISFTSSITVFGDRDFRIGLRCPESGSGLAGTLTLRNCSLSVSGDYERFYEIDGVKYHHILDPATGMPSDSGLHSVAVICDSGAVADALSTAIMVMGLDRAEKLYRSSSIPFEFICFTDENMIVSDGAEEIIDIGKTDYGFLRLRDAVKG